VNLLDQTIDVGSHHEEVSNREDIGIPICVWCSSRDKDCGPCTSFNNILSYFQAKCAFEDIPGFIVVTVKV